MLYTGWLPKTMASLFGACNKDLWDTHFETKVKFICSDNVFNLKENKIREFSSLGTLEPASKYNIHWKEVSSPNYEDSWREGIIETGLFYLLFSLETEFLWDTCLLCLPHNNTTKALSIVWLLRLKRSLQNPDFTKQVTMASRLKINKNCKLWKQWNHPLRLKLCITKEKVRNI